MSGLDALGSEPGFETHPVTPERFDDFADVINPNRRRTHCWCLSHRLQAKDIAAYPTRADAMRALVEREPPVVVTYASGVPVGWCSISPRRSIPRLEQSKLIRRLDEVEVWSIICVVVRGGFRRRGVTRAMLQGAVDYAASQGAPAVEAYPVDPPGRMDITMAFVGTRRMFESAGFPVVGQTDARASKMPRLIMRRTISPA